MLLFHDVQPWNLNQAENVKRYMTTLQEGQETKGVVKNLTDYGAFVDLGGIDGYLHITDMAWKRVKHPSEIVICRPRNCKLKY